MTRKGSMDEAREIEKQSRRQNRALAQFGAFTLKSHDLDGILTEACRLVCEALDTDFAKVMELQPDGTLLVRAGVGWKQGIVGAAKVQVEEGTSEHFAIAAGEPVISENADDEERFRYPEFMKQHNVKAFVNVPIIGTEDGKAYGILQVDSKTPRAFSEHDITFLRTYANLLAATIARLQMIQRLETAVHDKERLFIESQHRTKNNLQLINGFVRHRLRRASGDEAKEHLLDLSSRIETIHLLHEKLYSGGEIDALDLGAYLSDLAGTLLSVQSGGASVRLKIAVESIIVRPEIAIPVGLILNEFMTNSMKHAFGAGGGVIGVELMKVDDEISLRFSDNGKGLPADPDAHGGTGIGLIDGLAKQINAKTAWSSEGGTMLTLTFGT